MAATTVAPGTLDGAFDRRRNGLNLIRLVLALVVLGDHSLVLSGTVDTEFNGVNAGLVAVFGFFGISGFLLVGSATRLPPRDFLRRRCARIFPAFWVVLVVTAFVFAPASLVLSGSWCGTACYLGGADGPVAYIWRNAGLWIFQQDITGTPTGVPRAGLWNGSLWTLSFEFACYLTLLALAMAGLLRTVGRITAIWLATVLVGAIFTLTPLRHEFTQFSHQVVTPLLYLLPVFLTGAVIGAAMNRVPDSGSLAITSAIGYLVALMLPMDAAAGVFGLSLGTLAAPLLVYPLLWVGFHVRIPAMLRRHDISYGVYVYAFPIQQALLVIGALRFGLLAYLLLTMATVTVFAVLSWRLVESPAIRWGRR